MKSLVAAGGRVDKKDSAGNTPLMYAAKEGHGHVIRTLIQLGALANERNMTKETPMHFAARGGHLEAVSELLLMGGSPNVRYGIIYRKQSINFCLLCFILQNY